MGGLNKRTNSSVNHFGSSPEPPKSTGLQSGSSLTTRSIKELNPALKDSLLLNSVSISFNYATTAADGKRKSAF